MYQLIYFAILFSLLVWAAIYARRMFKRTQTVELAVHRIVVFFLVGLFLIAVVTLVRSLNVISLENVSLGQIPFDDYGLELYELSPDNKWLILNFTQAGFLLYDLEKGKREQVDIMEKLLIADAGRYDTCWKDNRSLVFRGTFSKVFYLLKLQEGKCQVHKLKPQDPSLLEHHRPGPELIDPGGIVQGYYFPGADYAQYAFQAPERGYSIKLPAEEQFWNSSYKALWQPPDLSYSDMEQRGAGGLFIQILYRGLKIARYGPKIEPPVILKPGLKQISSSPDARGIFYGVEWTGPNPLGKEISCLYFLNTRRRQVAKIDANFCDYAPALMLWTADSRKFIYLRKTDGRHIELRMVILPEPKRKSNEGMESLLKTD